MEATNAGRRDGGENGQKENDVSLREANKEAQAQLRKYHLPYPARDGPSLATIKSLEEGLRRMSGNFIGGGQTKKIGKKRKEGGSCFPTCDKKVNTQPPHHTDLVKPPGTGPGWWSPIQEAAIEHSPSPSLCKAPKFHPGHLSLVAAGSPGI